MLPVSRYSLLTQRTTIRHSLLLKNTISRRFLINEPKYDEAEILAKDINNKEFKSKRNETILNNRKDFIQPNNEITLQRIKKLQNGSLILISLIGITLGVSYYIYDRNDKLNKLKDEQEWEEISNGSIKKNRKKKKNQKKKNLSKPIVPLDQLDSTHPGLYIWGSVTNDTEWNDIPKRVTLFDNMLLRDVCLIDKTKNLVINDKGDLLNWDTTTNTLIPVLNGQKLTKVKESNNVLYGLNQNGEILVIPLNDLTNIQNQYVTQNKRIGILPRIPKINSYNNYSLKLDTSSLFDNRLNEKKIIDFDTGSTHLVFLSDASKVYSCATGYGEQSKDTLISRGQFGIPTFSQYSTYPELNKPYEIELLNKTIINKTVEFRKIVKIACGNYHTVALDSNGNLFTFGWNRYGQLGFNISYENEILPYPKQIPINYFIPWFNDSNNDVPIISKFNLEFIDIGCCKETTFMTIKNSLNKYRFFSMGNGFNGELGDGSYRNSQYQPTRIKIDGIISKWISNKDSNHIISEMKDGSIDCWGLNDKGQLGSWETKKIKTNKPLSLPLLIEPGITYKEDTKIDSIPKLHIDLTKQNLSVGKDSTCIYWKVST